jgi:hypothetical protein
MACAGISITIATKQYKGFPTITRFSVHYTTTITLQKVQNSFFLVEIFNGEGHLEGWPDSMIITPQISKTKPIFKLIHTLA